MIKKILLGLLIIALVFVGFQYMKEEDNGFTTEEATTMAESWIRDESPTFNEREGSNLTHIETNENEENYEVIFDFESNFSGYGPVGEEEMNAQVITPHTTKILVSSEEVVSVITDGVFDEMSAEMVEGEEEDTEGEEEVVEEEEAELVEVELFFTKLVDGQEEIISETREIRDSENLEEDTLLALLEGPLNEDFSTSISENAELLSLNIEDKTAIVDFSSDIEPGGGSAWVNAIRNQVERTLLQFDSIDEVNILIEGEEDRLQP